MRLDKWTIVIGGSTVAVTLVLGWLAGALPGVLTALAGAAFAIGWQVTTDHRSKAQEKQVLLRNAARELAPPRPATANCSFRTVITATTARTVAA